MNQIMDFLNKAGVFFLSTVEGDQPHVRPIGFVMEYDGKLAFMTDRRKSMCKQLNDNPKVEICAYDGQGNTLRICGKTMFITTNEAQQKALEVMPALGASYAVGDSNFVVYCLDEAKAVCSNMSGESQELAI